LSMSEALKQRSKLEDDANLFVLGSFSQISSIVKQRQVDRIVVALDERRGRFPLDQLLECRLRGTRVEDAAAFTESWSGKLLVENLHPSALIFSNGFKRTMILKGLKRWIDLLFSILGIVLSLPLSLAIALAIKLDSRGPVFYKQVRVGEEGRQFTLYKFRSMQVNAEQHGPVWAIIGDIRVTRVGRVMRKLRIDEIPQLINVLKGEMSFVGPRPERPFFADQLKHEIPFYVQRHSVKPGVTGWAQVCHSYASTKEDNLEKLKYDLYYIKYMSIFFDLMIIFKTVKIVILGRGAR
jgi:sugar transferase (PEP-CTERM system associated)